MYAPAIAGASGERQKTHNPFVRSASKGAKRAMLKSRGAPPSGSSVKESLASKHSYEHAAPHGATDSVYSVADLSPDLKGAPLQPGGQVAKRDSFLLK